MRQLADVPKGDAISGEVVLARAYDPYGVTAYSSGAAQTSYGFTAEYTSAAGLIYLRARQYDPSVGRFTSRDTWGGDYNRPLSLNRWNYVQSNPIVYRDPSGQWCVAGNSLGPGEGCTREQEQRWAPFWLNSSQIWYKLTHWTEDSLYYVEGFVFEYYDTMGLFLPSISVLIYDELTGCGSSGDYWRGRYHFLQHDQRVVAGRYFARAFLFIQSAAEVGIGVAGIGGGLGISGTGVGVIAGIPVSALALAVTAHGALVFGTLLAKEAAMPLPPLYFVATGSGNGGGSSGGGRSLQDILNLDDVEFLRWARLKKPVYQLYSAEDARAIWERLERAGVEPVLNPPHTSGVWKVSHINVRGTTIHIPVSPDFVP